MIISNVLPETNCNIQIPQVNNPLDMRDCEHCSKKNVCKYKERVEEAIEHFDNLFSGDDKQFTDLTLVTEIRCKEFAMGYTGVR